jgi:hypothetical protein
MIKDRLAKAGMHGMTYCSFNLILVVSQSASKWFSPPSSLGAGAYILTGPVLPTDVIGQMICPWEIISHTDAARPVAQVT